MDFIRHALHFSASEFPQLARVSIVVERVDLAKRRWRGVAGDGREFGFDLDAPLWHGAVFYVTDSVYYCILQQPERVLEVGFTDPTAAARLGWTIGSLHFPMEVEHGTIRVADDIALRQLFEREQIHYREGRAVFQPMKAVSHAH
jgi:urease accessory protein